MGILEVYLNEIIDCWCIYMKTLKEKMLIELRGQVLGCGKSGKKTVNKVVTISAFFYSFCIFILS